MRRQFFRSLLMGGKIADNQPAPLKDEPGLDLNVEIDTVFGFYDATVKSLVLDAKRRGGKLTYLEGGGRLNGEAPIAVHVEQKPGRPRILTSDATDAGSAFRLTGFYGSAQGRHHEPPGESGWRQRRGKNRRPRYPAF